MKNKESLFSKKGNEVDDIIKTNKSTPQQQAAASQEAYTNKKWNKKDKKRTPDPNDNINMR